MKALLLSFILLAGATLAHAQQFDEQNNYININESPATQVLQTQIDQKSWSDRLLGNTSFSYYQQFLGPTASGSLKETYNPFVEGRAPLQSFHSFNLRHKINSSWAVGTTLTATDGYTKDVQTQYGSNTARHEWFNARLYVSLPSLDLPGFKLFTTISYEHPTSSISKQDEMKYGLVLSQSIAFNLPNPDWSAGILGQYYRAYYKNNVKVIPSIYGFDPFLIPMQTVIISGGPYLSYRINDKWMLNSLLSFDWDQRGDQTNSGHYNNNLDHRARVGATYYPTIKYLSSVGVFSQGLLKFRPSTTAFGAEMALKF